MTTRQHRAAITAAAAAAVLAACDSGGLSVVSDPSDLVPGAGSVSVVADPSDLIQGAEFIDWEELPAEAQGVRPPVVEGAGFLGEAATEYWGVAVVLPGSESRRLLIAVWHNACQPAIAVAAPDPAGARLSVSIADAETDCGEMLKMWPFEVTLNRDVDPATLVMDVSDSRPQGLTRLLGGAEGMLMARALVRACDDWPGGEGCPSLPVCLVESVEAELRVAVEQVFPTGALLVESLPDAGLTGGAPGAECLVMQVDYEVYYRSETVVGFNVWIGDTAHVYWFQQEGSVWVDVSPEEVGITDPTAIP